jgi:dihydropteroate synthase
MEVFKALEAPILVGLSRKSMVWRTLGITAEDALNGTTALHSVALLKGASILRVHDVKEALQVVKLFAAMSPPISPP